MFCENCDVFLQTLSSLGYGAHCAANRDEAREIVLGLVGSGSVGFGGSVTSVELGLPAALRERGNEVFFHWDEEPARRPEMLKKAAVADWYVSSVNAIALNGTIINIDGTGNRVAAMIAGPKNVVLCIGRNKLAADTEAAMERIRATASPLNAKRLARKTPCTATGHCMDCSSPDRICNMTVSIRSKPPLMESYHIVLIDEDLGY